MVSPRRLSWLLLAGLIAGYVAHYWHLQRGHIDFFTDQCESSRAALAAVRVLPAPDFHLRHFEGGNPPLHAMVASNLMFWSHSYSWMVFLLNLFYLALLAASLCLLGSELGGPLVGELAAIIMLLYPHTFFLFHMYSLDLPLAAVVTLSLYALVKSESFASFPWTVVFSACLVWGMLLKDVFGAFLIGPAIVAAAAALARIAKERRFGKSLNLAVPALIAGPFLYVYYFSNSFYTRGLMRPLEEAVSSGIGPAVTTTGLWEYQLTPPFFLLLIAGVAAFVGRRAPGRWLLAAWVILPSLAVSLMPHWKSVRYLVPAHPAFALASAFGVAWAIDRMKARSAVVLMSICCLLGAGQLWDLVHGGVLASLRVGDWRYFREDKNSCVSVPCRREVEKYFLAMIRDLGLTKGRWAKAVVNRRCGFIVENLPQYAALQGAQVRMVPLFEALDREDWEWVMRDADFYLLVTPTAAVAEIEREGFAFKWMADDGLYYKDHDTPRFDGKTLARLKQVWGEISGHLALLDGVRIKGSVCWVYRLRRGPGGPR